MKIGTTTPNKTDAMKRLSIYCMALAVLALGSCSMEQESIVPEEIPGMKFTAVWSDEASRTSLDENGTSVLWDPGDEIFIFQGVTAGGPSAMGKFTSTNTARQSTATFTGKLEGEGIGDYIAVYPYYEFHEQGAATDISEMGFGVGTIVGHMLNPVQKGVEGSFDTRTAPAAAVSSTNELVFHNICGGVRFSVSRSGIEKVVFTSVDGTPMSGPTYITFDGDGVAVIPSNWMKEMGETPSLPFVEVVAPEGGFVPGKNYYAIMWPYTHAEGVEVTLYGDGVKAERTLSGPVTVKRSVFGKLDNIDSGLEYVPTTPVPEIVDLGLSVKWASFNLGASAPEEYGDYYAWGETAPRSIYGISYFYEFYDLVYKWYKGEDGRLTKYCNNSEYGYNGFTDNKTVLDPEDDAATVNLGGNWRMPTLLEYQELLENCTETLTTINGVNGMKFTSNKPGYTDRWIFLPAAGVRDVTYLFNPGEYGNYWSSTLENDDPDNAYDLFFESEYRKWNGSFTRSYGLPVRPVYAGEVVHVTGVELNESSLQIEMGSTAQLMATVTPEDASNKSVVWSSSDESIATVSDAGVVSGIGVGTVVITATTVDGGFTAECTVTMKAVPPMTDLGKTFVPVDLGLPSGIKWASFNLGATKPEEYGDYFAWGETMPKSNYSWSTYKFGTSSSGPFSKYNTNSSYGEVDNKTVLDPEDDAAAVALGGSWRMATYYEWNELKTKCTWTWTTQNGVKGRLVTGPNGNSIFLPAAGYLDGTGLYRAGSRGRYWSTHLFEGTFLPYCAYFLEFDSDSVMNEYLYRHYGQSIRPVYAAPLHVTGISMNESDIQIHIGATVLLIATVTPEAVSDKRVTWYSSDESNVTVSEDGVVSAVGIGTAIITATSVDGGLTVSCTVSSVDSNYDAPEMVDLGLPSKIKWASFNLGASKPEQCGVYFAWGETTPKSDYSWSTYKWCTGDERTMTKYCNKSSYGYNRFTDNKTVLDPEDDAATVNLGGSWRMATNAEWDELKTMCTWSLTTQNGVYGRLVTGPNGNSIFLPAAGTRQGTSLYNVGDTGDYWSSTLYTDNPSRAYYVFFWFSMVDSNSSRYAGYAIRPVSE